MSLESKVKQIFKDVLGISPDEIQPDQPLNQDMGMDSTEMVEITVAIKKEFNLDIGNNAIKKDMTFNQVIQFLQKQGVAV